MSWINGSVYYIVYPSGDRTKLSVAEISLACDYEVNDYALASKKRFYEEEKDEAYRYAKQLASENNLVFIDDRQNSYLD